MGARVTEAFRKALEAALASLGSVAEETGRSYRALRYYRDGGRRVTAEAARDLVRYLRARASQLTAAADQLEAALQEEDADA